MRLPNIDPRAALLGEEALESRYCSLISSCIRNDAERFAEQLGSLPDGDEELQAFLVRHGLMGWLSCMLRTHQWSAPVSPALRAGLDQASERQWLDNLMLLRRTQQLLQSDDALGEQVLVVKGPALAASIYGDIDARISGDIDLLVSPHLSVFEASALLKRQGFRHASPLLFSERVFRPFIHAFELDHDGCSVDLHWAIRAHCSFAVDYTRLWESRVRYEAHGCSFWALDHEYSLVLRIIQVFDDLQLQRVVVSALVDIYALTEQLHRRGLDWEQFFDRRAREHTATIVAFVLLGVLELFHADELAAALSPAALRHLQTVPAHPHLERLAALSSRSFAMHLYTTPRPVSWLWWAAAKPFRIAAYDRSVRHRIDALKGWLGQRAPSVDDL